MDTTEPTVRRLAAEEFRRRLDDIMAEVAAAESQVLVELDGKPALAVIPVADFRLLQRLWAARRREFAALHASWEAFKDVPADEIEREITRALAAIRAEEEAEREWLPAASG